MIRSNEETMTHRTAESYFKSIAVVIAAANRLAHAEFLELILQNELKVRHQRLLVATNLAPPTNWETITTNIAATNGLIQFVDPELTNTNACFYRTMTP